MLSSVIARFIAGTLVAPYLLVGCAQGPTSPPLHSQVLLSLQPSQQQPLANTFGKFIYTAQFYGEDLSVYKRQGLTLTFVTTLTSGVSSPQGTMATINGWWYVANGGHSNVLVYRSTKHGPTGPVAALDDYGQFPSNVSVTPNRKLVAVSNFSTTSSGPGSVSVYLDRKAEPSRILTYGSEPVQGAGIAIDHHGNCYWAFNDPKTQKGSIVEFGGCNGSGVVVVSSIPKAGGIVFDQRDDLYYIDQTYGIYKCDGTANCRKFSNGFGLPTNINFDYKHKHLWVADATGYIDAVDPNEGTILYTTQAVGGPTDPPFGIAPAPGG